MWALVIRVGFWGDCGHKSEATTVSDDLVCMIDIVIIWNPEDFS